MKILDRYILKEYLQTLLFIFSLVLVVMVVTTAFGERKVLFRYKPDLLVAVMYLAYLIPDSIAEVVPLIVLMTAFYFLHRMNRQNELLELFVGGWSSGRIIVPVLLVSFVVSVGLLFADEYFVAPCSAKAKDILAYQIQKQEKVRHNQAGLWIHGAENRFYRIEFYDLDAKEMRNVFLIEETPDNTSLVKAYQAKRAVWSYGLWNFENGTYYEFDGAKIVKKEPFTLKLMALDEKPKDFEGSQLAIRQMGIRDLRRIIGLYKRSGEALSKYQAQLSYKVAFPFSCFVLTLIGFSWSLRMRFSGISIDLMIAVLVGMVFYGLVALCTSLGAWGIAPLLSVWMPLLLFAAFGALLLYRRQVMPSR